MIQIKSWLTGKVIFEADVENIKACVELAVSKSVSLNDAKLNGAKLNYAELNYAKLNGAELVRIDGLKFSVIISPTHVHVGCKRFTIERFRSIDFDKFKDHASCFHQYPIVIAMLDAIALQNNNKSEAA